MNKRIFGCFELLFHILGHAKGRNSVILIQDRGNINMILIESK